MGSLTTRCLSVSFGYTTNQFVLGVPLGDRRPDMFIRDHRLHVFGYMSVQDYHFTAEVEVRAKASWRLTRSDCGEP
ncbi:hypothetical protein E5676_scaffold14G00350 [Cucumis melo var. makuwa]|uniref:Uncharacterized protein n=1 Tax=Cucumis melo var. makuwa TaxID=1194695 RepID=A0A5A7VF86_CUCMM|nr:hypothetical protein E6C27_scaffold38G00720 [Cucumis melo var. makuwa]TYK26268.1 hypothetical protein E5676_scaffold14G00350 [Cucumis melo var. makuwa]